MPRNETDRAVEKIIVPILTYVEMKLVEKQVTCGVDLIVPMSRNPDGGGPVIWRWAPGNDEAAEGDQEQRNAEDMVLDYLREVLYLFKPKKSSGASALCVNKRAKSTIKGFWQHIKESNAKLPILVPYLGSIPDVRGQYFKDLLYRSRTLAEWEKPEPYAEVSKLIKGAVDDRLRSYAKSTGTRPLVLERLAGRLKELATARGEYAEASLRSCVEALVYLDARDPRTAETALPAPDVPLLVGKKTADKVGRALGKSLEKRDADGAHPVVIVAGKVGSGRATAMLRATSSELGEEGLAHAFWYRFDGSLRKTVCSAVLGRNGNTDEDERFDQAVHALSTLSRSSSGRVLVALVDVEEAALESGCEDLARVTGTGAVVMMTVSGGEEMELPEGFVDSIIVRVGAASEDDLAKMGRAYAERACRELWSLDTSDTEALAKLCGGNAGLIALASACAGRAGSVDSVKKALEGSPDPVRDAVRVLRGCVGDTSSVAALALLPPEGVSVRTVRALVRGDVPLLLWLLDAGVIMRDAVSGRIMLRGALGAGIARTLAEEDLKNHDDPSRSILGKAADGLWSDVSGVGTWSTLEEAMACYERLLELLGDHEGAWPTLCRARLARLYEKTSRTWLALREHEGVLERLERAYRDHSAMHDAGGDLADLGCPDRAASLAEEYLRLGHVQMQYARRAEAAKTFDSGLDVLGRRRPSRGRSALRARLLREKGWCLHEEWKRGGGSPDVLEKAIQAKREALEELRKLDPSATGRELQNVLSTFGYSLIESADASERAEAVERAREGLCVLYEDLTGRNGKEAVECPKDAAGRVKTCRGQFAEALYFYGRILAGGERPDERRASEQETNEERTKRLEKALELECIALEIREELEPEKWNMKRALTLASIGMIEWILGKEDEARRHLGEAMKIQDHRTHVTDEYGARTGKRRESGPITDWFYRAFPKEKAADEAMASEGDD